MIAVGDAFDMVEDASDVRDSALTCHNRVDFRDFVT